MAAPVQIGDEVFGVIRIAQAEQGRFFSQLDEKLLIYFCNNLAVLVQNAYLFENTEKEKDDEIQRLRQNLPELQKLSKSLQKDISSIQINLSKLFPEDELHKVKIGPFTMQKKLQNKKKVFIGMPFASKYFNVLEYAIKPALDVVGLTPWIATEQKSPIELMRKIIEGICECHAAIIDISEWNANVMFELGILYGQAHPVVLINEGGAPLPSDLKGQTYIPYGRYDELKDELVQYFKNIQRA